MCDVMLTVDYQRIHRVTGIIIIIIIYRIFPGYLQL
jgi:hypothetical protein